MREVDEQDPFIFHASVAENVRYARPAATTDDVLHALLAAGLEQVVARLPQGLDSLVGERGRRLSAGERQRLAIARVFLTDPAVLVLDEATGALDPSSERLVLDGYADVMRGRTTIIITHRLELARRAERIVVIQEGKVVEDGFPGRVELDGRAFRGLFLDSVAG